METKALRQLQEKILRNVGKLISAGFPMIASSAVFAHDRSLQFAGIDCILCLRKAVGPPTSLSKG